MTGAVRGIEVHAMEDSETAVSDPVERAVAAKVGSVHVRTAVTVVSVHAGRTGAGAAGRFLDELLGVAGLQREDVYITNVVKHRPPENRDPRPDEVAACIPYLWRQVEIIQPKVIVTLGRFALNVFFPEGRMMRDH